nr:hypothetical protein [Tanacetum cinerariifolium]
MYRERFGRDEDTLGESTRVNESHNNNGTGSSGGSTAGFRRVGYKSGGSQAGQPGLYLRGTNINFCLLIYIIICT